MNETKSMVDTAKRLSGPGAKNPKTHVWINLDSQQWHPTVSQNMKLHRLPHKAAAEMQLNATNFNTASGFILRWVWYTVTEMLIKTQDQAQYVTLPTNHETKVRVGTPVHI